MSLPLIYHPDYSYPFPQRHRFPMDKFARLYHWLTQQGIVRRQQLFRPGRARLPLLAQAHCPDYLHRFISNQLTDKAQRRIGLPWSEALVRRTCIAPMGTLLSAQLALQHGLACHLAGGTHHAHRDFGSGFCVLNDLAFAARLLLAGQQVQRLLIFDCDVHQGDGTASMLADEPRAFTCSIHCEKNFPVRKARSDLDIGLPLAMGDDAYLETVFSTFENLLEQQRPQLVLYDAGVDVYQGDPLGRLNISLAGIARRDHGILQRCLQRGIPVATVIGGGYDDDRDALTRRHAIVIEQAARLRGWQPSAAV